MIPCYVVYKAEHLWTTWTGGPIGIRYNRSCSGWFDTCSFTDWFESICAPHIKDLPGRKVLIGDHFSSHFTEKVLKLARQKNISFVCLLLNATHMAEPLDVTFYGPLKRYWRKASGQKATTSTQDMFPSLLKNICSLVSLKH